MITTVTTTTTTVITTAAASVVCFDCYSYADPLTDSERNYWWHCGRTRAASELCIEYCNCAFALSVCGHGRVQSRRYITLRRPEIFGKARRHYSRRALLLLPHRRALPEVYVPRNADGFRPHSLLH